MSLVPYFFLIYINSLFSCPFKGLLTAFADDVGFSYGSNSVLDLISDLNWDLFLLRDWFAKHSLSISSKTKIMFFSLSTQSIIGPEIFYHAPDCLKFPLSTCFCNAGSSSSSFNTDICCNDNCFQVECVNEFKYLGLVIDAQLNFNSRLEVLRNYFRENLLFSEERLL